MDFYDILLAKKLSGGGGGGSAVLINKNISSNGTYNASSDNADGYKKVVVSVPNPSTGSLSITSNNTYDVTNYASAVVNVPQGITPTGTLNITSNDTYDVTNYASAVVNVSGGYDLLDIVKKTEPSGDVVLDSDSNFNVRTYFFQGCTGITSFSSNKAKELGGYSFQKCSNMTSVNCPNCTKLEISVFEDCSKLASITLSNNYSVANNCFRNCTLLQDFECWANGTASTLFYGDTSLRFVDFKNLNLYRLEQNCFQNCSALKTLVLRKTSDVVGLHNVNAFSGTPFASGGSGGTIYVPSALLSSYPTATNWSTMNGYGTITWKAIEGSIYE